MPDLEPALVRELGERAGIVRWSLAPDRFAAILARSLDKSFAAGRPSPSVTASFLRSLHLEDLALACACEDGVEQAWDHFVREFRPVLYRAAGAIDPGGEARDLADAVYADLYGLGERDGVRQSLFRYYHGRSSLATWLRSVLAQRHVDAVRARRRLVALPEEPADLPTAPPATGAPDRGRHLALLGAVLAGVLGRLMPRDRLRLACYHAQRLTLREIGRLTGEHEATVSRHLTRTRREVRLAVEQALRREHGMGEAELAECVAVGQAEAGMFDVDALLGEEPVRKGGAPARSRVEG